MTRIRTIVLSAATIAALGGMAACSSSSGTDQNSSSSPSPVATKTAVATTTVPAAGKATTSGSGTVNAPVSTTGSTGRSGTSACAESQLRANVANDDIKGLNRHVVRATFTNKSGSTCTLTGFPGAAIEDGSNEQVQQAKRIVGGPVGGTIEKSRTVTLRSGATAYAYLEGSSTREKGAAQAGCDGAKYPRILIAPPNTDTPVPFTIGWPQCYSFQVHPVRVD